MSRFNKHNGRRNKSGKDEFMTTYFTVAEEKKFFNVIKRTAGLLAKRDYAMFGLLRSSGVRVNTLVSLCVDEVLEALSSVDNYLPLRDDICKGRRGYTVFISAKVRTSLEELVRLHKKINPETDELVLNKSGKALSARMVQIRMKYWLEIAGLNPNATPHWWRHTKAMRIMHNSSAKDPRMVVKKVLGHSSITSTEIYTKPTKEDFEESAGA